MKRLFLLLVLGICFLSGCATSFKLSPIIEPDGQHDLIYVDGNEVAVSILPGSIVALYGQKTVSNELVLHVFCYNISENRADVLPDKFVVTGIEVEYFDDYSKLQKFDEKNLVAYSADEYMKKIQKDQQWKMFAQALSGAMNSYNAGYSTSTTTGTYSGSSGSGSFSGTTQTYDPAKQAMVNAENQRRLESMRGQFELINATTEAGLLKRTTLFSSQAAEGNVIARYIPAKRYRVTIPIGDELHLFELVPPQTK
jgi:hypothetical protein